MARASIILLICLAIVFSTASARGQATPKWSEGNAVPPPLFLSPLLSNPSYARQLSLVKNLMNSTACVELLHSSHFKMIVQGYDFPSFSGLFTVDNETNGNTFFWFFPSETDAKNAPVIMWLQGGPGASSLYGLFNENGPFTVSSADNATLISNPYRWTQNFSLLFVDNPLGVGFSFTDSNDGYVTSEVDVARDLLSFLDQFFTIFVDFRGNDFYAIGESYGGKYVPSIGYAIQMANKNRSPEMQINLKGIAIGNGFIDPPTQLQGFADLLFWSSSCDENEYEALLDYETTIQDAFGRGDLKTVFFTVEEMMLGGFYPYPTYFENITGSPDYFNLLFPTYPDNPFPEFLNLPQTRAALHVGNIPYILSNKTVEQYLIPDWASSVQPYVISLLEGGYNVLVYNGQDDAILSGPQVELTLWEMQWSGQASYRSAKKKVWKVEPSDTEVAGYYRNGSNLYQAIVRTAGHMVPLDQPRAALDLITRYITGAL